MHIEDVSDDVRDDWRKHSPYTKGNFQLEQVVTGWRAKYSVLDLRLKK
jgi:hypothetical protein